MATGRNGRETTIDAVSRAMLLLLLHVHCWITNLENRQSFNVSTLVVVVVRVVLFQFSILSLHVRTSLLSNFRFC